MDDMGNVGGDAMRGDVGDDAGNVTIGRGNRQRVEERSGGGAGNMYVAGDRESDWRRVDDAIGGMRLDIRFLAEKVESMTRMLYHAASFEDKMERQIRNVYIIGIVVALLLLAAGIWVFWYTDRSLFALSERIKELEYLFRQNWTTPERFP